MTCNEVRNVLASLDHDVQIPVDVRSHLEMCRQCRYVATTMIDIESTVLAIYTIADEEERVVHAVMNRIAAYSPGNPISEAGTSLITWIAGALLLSGALVAVRFSEPFQYLSHSHIGNSVDLWVTLSLGTILAGYLCAFAGRSVTRRGGTDRPDRYISDTD